VCPEDEKLAIMKCFPPQKNLNQLIKELLLKETEFIVLPKNFWENWKSYVGFEDGHILTHF